MRLGSLGAEALAPPRPHDHDANKQSLVVATMPPPPTTTPVLVAPPNAVVDVTSTTAHSLPLVRKARLVAVLGHPDGNCTASGPSLPVAAAAVAPVADANTSAAIVGCTCQLCANNVILVTVTPLYSSFVGGGEEMGVQG